MTSDLRVVVLRDQHPVGHGFFHDCALRSTQHGEAFRYVYDCGGGRNIKPAVDAYADSLGGSEIDLLFVSHFHADHVSGLPRLLSRTRVRRAVIPYVSRNERLLILFRNAARGFLSVDATRLALDARGWLESRGVEQVTEVEHSGQPRDTGDAFTPNDTNGTAWETKLVAPNGQVLARDSERWPARIDDQHQVVTRTQNLVWALTPYVRTATPADVDQLTRALGKLATFDPSDLVSPANLATMRKAFQTVWRDINWTSLCLASTPQAVERLSHVRVARSGGRSFHSSWWHAEHHGSRRGALPTGWLGLGDAVLADAREVASIAKHLGPDVLARINTHSLPHHGSADNFCPELLGLVPDPHALRYATAKHESTKHPAPFVRRQIAELGLELSLVTEHPSSRLTEQIAYYFE